jgi:hypothetical protein
MVKSFVAAERTPTINPQQIGGHRNLSPPVPKSIQVPGIICVNE